MRYLLLALLLLSIPSVARADTFIVDQNGGPGTDFLDLTQAVAAPAVLSGDTLLVRGGSYTGFSTSKGLSIVEWGGSVGISDPITIHDLAAGHWFSMQGVWCEYWTVTIVDCAGVVFLEEMECLELRITDAADVRVRAVEVDAIGSGPGGLGDPAVVVQGASRVELVECLLIGGDGEYGCDGNSAGDGGVGLIVEDTARVHVALCDIEGGWGGDDCHAWGGGPPGDGGDGVQVESAAELIASGLPANDISGGLGGYDFWNVQLGDDGEGLSNQGAARVSGVTISSVVNTGYLEQPSSPDPVLTSTHLPDGRVHVEIHGAVGGNVRLYLGTKPILPATPSLVKPALTVPRRAIPVGVIGPSGSIGFDFRFLLPVPFGARFQLLLQASVVHGGQTVRSSSGTMMRP